ncbi:MAG: flagellar basal body P-ring protein FlgI [Desulfobacteraceae bacterium]|nr:flagellar basal body P-ring protein FlgI [Desulfobacteraceae bacterium]
MRNRFVHHLKVLGWFVFMLILIFGMTPDLFAARIKDLAGIKGIRTNQLTGYGLVVGLNGTGDKDGVSFTTQALANMMEKMNVYVEQSGLKVKNVAAVMITADIPAFARIGDKIDITVSSLGDAKSLKGGTLLMTPLKGVDKKVYALAQGPLSFGVPSSANDRDSHLLVGRIVNGASIEKEIPFKLNGKKQLILSLFRPDFTTAKRMTDTINASIGHNVAETIDASALRLRVPDNMVKKNVAEFIADIETLSVVPDTRARVVINSKTGTVVIGKDVTISSVAVAHGDLTVTIDDDPQNVKKESLMQLSGTSTIGELVRGLNAIGVKPKDLIGIIQGIKAAGALQAELEIM